MGQWRIAPPTGQYMCCENVNIPLGLALNRPDGMQLVPATYIGAGRILKVEGHSGGCNYFGAKRRKKYFWCPHFSVVPTQFLMELGAQPSKLNNSVTSNLLGYITVSLFAK